MRCALFMQLTEMLCIVQNVNAYQNSANINHHQWSSDIRPQQHQQYQQHQQHQQQQQHRQQQQQQQLNSQTNSFEDDTSFDSAQTVLYSSFPSTTPSSLSYWSDTVRCFSCMSPIYEAAWSELQNVYYAPRNFTKLCDMENVNPYSVQSVACQSVCIRMTEILVIGGLRIKTNIRGCMDNILKGGFNKTVVTRHRWYQRDSCNQYQKRVLFQLPAERSDDSLISLCVCYNDYCNGAASGSGSEQPNFRLLLPLYSIVILLLIYR